MKRDLGVAERVELTPYDPAWTQQYEHEAEPIRRALGSYEGFTIEHIGSTAIPGMPSKPIIDIVVGVGDITSIPRPRVYSQFLIPRNIRKNGELLPHV
jgi:GrpB-like predicted nucleotidyltransferase (UPF0157 family)